MKTMKIVPTNNNEPGLLGCLVDFQEALSVDDLRSDISNLSRPIRSHLASFHKKGTPEIQLV